jgi:DNA invertase Pin-like site-specific DNA recombinase
VNKTYGYVRVSSRDQNEERQLIAMRQYPVPEKQIYIDKKSGRDFNRPAYQRLMKKLSPGDLLVVKSIDRLGRNYDEIVDQWRRLTREYHVDINVLDMPLLNTTTCKDILGTFISDLVLQILSYCAHMEREAIHQRQAEGIAAAMARGVHFGRPEKELPPEFDIIYAYWQSKAISGREAARRLGVNHKTFFKWADAASQNFFNQLGEKGRL